MTPILSLSASTPHVVELVSVVVVSVVVVYVVVVSVVVVSVVVVFVSELRDAV